ncbi:MAG: hypothetical protein KDI59_11635 [Xanthomonadales bacterium]|nr:hypothetical protein [Xanthomonadales bacterium]
MNSFKLVFIILLITNFTGCEVETLPPPCKNFEMIIKKSDIKQKFEYFEIFFKNEGYKKYVNIYSDIGVYRYFFVKSKNTNVLIENSANKLNHFNIIINSPNISAGFNNEVQHSSF